MDVALALGGGGIKGIAHLGVIRQLERAGVRIRAVSGTSAGGLVGALFSAGLSSTQIINLVDRMVATNLFKRGPNDGPSLMGLAGFTSIMIEAIENRCFTDLQIPFACTAVDVNTGTEFILQDGPVIDAVLATIAVPGVFPPRRMGNATLVDGGIMDPVPVALARKLAPQLPVIAVVLSPARDKWARVPPMHLPITPPLPIPSPIVESLTRMRYAQALQIYIESMDISSRMLTEMRLAIDRPDVIIRPDVDRFGILDQLNSHQINELLQAGDRAALAALTEIRESTSFLSQVIRKLRKNENGSPAHLSIHDE
ncbi:MAG TPA: patatin-like phospholipase family protein [Anaerolineaceae bacterium]|nr:patatin-like phospholipase family protein [Anaerolineaceae bacterium]